MQENKIEIGCKKPRKLQRCRHFLFFLLLLSSCSTDNHENKRQETIQISLMKQIISRLSEVAITNPEEINIQELLHMFSLGNANEKWISSPGLKVFWVASDIAKWRNQDVHATEIAIYSKVASKRLNDAEVFGVTFTGSVVRDGCVPIGNRSFVKLELHGEVFSLPSSLSQGKGVIQKAPIKTGIE